MEIKYLCPFWGSSNLSAKEFVNKALESGYDGIEVNAPGDEHFIQELNETVNDTKCSLVAQQWLPPQTESVEEYKARMLANLNRLLKLNPLFINSHTGKDHFSFEENSNLLDACFAFTKETGVEIVHETHRGRFNFHSYSTLAYLRKYKDLKLNADFSHFTNVSESMLADQKHILEKLIGHIRYIHARVGFEQGPQVNNPFAPEWKANLDRFVSWWQKILDLAKGRGEEVFYICPEFGPFPYIQQLPFTKEETAVQWDINVQMMEYLRETL